MRWKLISIALIVAGSALTLLSWSQPWFRLELVDDAGAAGTAIDVAGSTASPALAAFALAALALAGALAIAGPLIRFVLGVLAIVLGGCVLLAAGITMGDPVAAVAPVVTETTGVTGSEPVAALVASAVATWWPVVAFVGGGALGAGGVAVLTTAARWPTSSRRYGGERMTLADEPVVSDASADSRPAPAGEPAAAPPEATVDGDGAGAGAAPDRAVDAWDDLSKGDDPTR